MELYLIPFLVSGWLSYWIFKIPNTIWGTSAIETQKQFWQENWKLFILSIGGLLFLVFGGNDIPDSWGKISGPVTAFMAGGSIPSIVMNAIPVLQRIFKQAPTNEN